MPFGKELKKAEKKIETETKKVRDQVTTETKKFTNDLDNNVHNIKELLSSLGINHENREEFDIGMPHPLDPLNKQEPIQYRWIASTSNSGDAHQQKAEQAKLVLKSLVEAKRGNDANDVTPEFKDHFLKLNLDGVVSFMNTANKLGIYNYGCITNTLNGLSEGYYPEKWNNVTTEE